MQWTKRILSRGFYNRDPETVARALLGKYLVRELRGVYLVGRIVETEAYLPSGDPASHSFIGETRRNASMFKEGGHAYVYVMHRHHLFNVVTEGPHKPGAVLIRAVEPLEQVDVMHSLRPTARSEDLTNGPGKLCAAFGITKAFDGSDLTNPKNELFVAEGIERLPPSDVLRTLRIGISRGQDMPLRFCITDNRFVSRKRKAA